MQKHALQELYNITSVVEVITKRIRICKQINFYLELYLAFLCMITNLYVLALKAVFAYTLFFLDSELSKFSILNEK